MYAKHEAAQLKKEFWTSFGQYMKPVPSAEGETINWINYKTGEKNISFKMHADNKTAVIAIELNHSDAEIQQLYFEQFRQMENLLQEYLNEEWNWELHFVTLEGKILSRIFKTLPDVSVYNKNNWPDLISFFKPRIIALDGFWSGAKYAFELLR